MAENKKSFLLYCDQIELFTELPDEIAGQLIKHIFRYVNDENPETDDLLLKTAFNPIKNQLKRDLKKYDVIREKRSQAGKRSAEARQKTAEQNQQVLTSVESVQQKSTNPTVTDNVNVNVNDNVNDNVIDKDIETKVFTGDEHLCFQECRSFFPEHLQPKTSKDVDKWLDTISKLIRIDKIPPDKIIEIVKKTRQDSFWSKNFLSLTKLRKNNKEGIKFVVVFNEIIKSKSNGTSENRTTEERLADIYSKEDIS